MLATLPLSGWTNFYVIVGSAAAALVGVQFVVIALIANRHIAPNGDSIHAFGTPTVVHMCGALVVSAAMSAPWPALAALAAVIAACGLAGLGYGVVVVRRTRRQTSYKPVFEDWLWHAALPCAFYATIGLAGLTLRARPTLALFAVAGATLGLLVVGIHNAWDTVTYVVIDLGREETKKD